MIATNQDFQCLAERRTAGIRLPVHIRRNVCTPNLHDENSVRDCSLTDLKATASGTSWVTGRYPALIQTHHGEVRTWILFQVASVCRATNLCRNMKVVQFPPRVRLDGWLFVRSWRRTPSWIMARVCLLGTEIWLHEVIWKVMRTFRLNWYRIVVKLVGRLSEMRAWWTFRTEWEKSVFFLLKELEIPWLRFE
jgi:hypothetical protein